MLGFRLSLILSLALSLGVPQICNAKGLYLSLGPTGTAIFYQGTNSNSNHFGGGFAADVRVRYRFSRRFASIRFEPFFHYAIQYTVSGSERQLLSQWGAGADLRIHPLVVGASVGLASGEFLAGQAGTITYLDPSVRLGLATDLSWTTGFLAIASWHRAGGRFASGTTLNLDQISFEMLFQFRLFGGYD